MKKLTTSLFLLLVGAATLAEPDEDLYQKQLDYIYSIRLNDIHEAKEQLDKLALDINKLSKSQQTRFYNLRAHSEVIRGNLEKSLEYSEKAQALAESYDLLARAKSLEVVALAASGDYQKSFIELYEILDRIEDIESPDLKQGILQNALSQHTNAGIFDKSLELSRKILAYAKRYKSDYYQCFGFLELTLLNLTLGNHEQVQFDIDNATEQCQKTQNNLAFLTLDVYKAKLLKETGNAAKAKRIYEENYDRLKTFGWKSMLVDAQISMANLYFELKELDKVESLALMAYQYAKKVNHIREVQDSSLILSKYYAAQNDKDKADFYKSEYLEASNELNMQLQKKRIAYYQAMNYRALQQPDAEDEDMANWESKKKINLPAGIEFESPHP